MARISSLNGSALQRVGIRSAKSTPDVVIPLTGEELTMKSNVNFNGKWMYRVDKVKVDECPTGLVPPPFCQHDVNECENARYPCHKQAFCINTKGSFFCSCKDGWTGDGFHCFELNACYVASRLICGQNASCHTARYKNARPECLCDDGFVGDGFTCIPIPAVSDDRLNNMATKETSVPKSDVRQLPKENKRKGPEVQTITNRLSWSFRNMANVEAEMAEHPESIAVQSTGGPSTEVKSALPPLTNVMPQRRKLFVPRNVSEEPKNAEILLEEKILPIVLPFILGAIWLVLLTVLVMFWLKRKSRRKEHQHSVRSINEYNASRKGGDSTFDNYWPSNSHLWTVRSQMQSDDVSSVHNCIHGLIEC
ncbi:unnamed protein product [Soboliphyme baturini]|uniref:EGF-like domain-containing protein n=1 Tax=Soboliphyme baturini TaxID=241478 RepID=A0A183IL41_9BILA|nr:unnamed protein product [Soboliphyme baturini]